MHTTESKRKKKKILKHIEKMHDKEVYIATLKHCVCSIKEEGTLRKERDILYVMMPRCEAYFNVIYEMNRVQSVSNSV